MKVLCVFMGRDSAVSTAIHYRLDSPGTESWWGERFSISIQTGPGAHPGSCTTGTASLSGVKQLGCGVDHLSPSSANFK